MQNKVDELLKFGIKIAKKAGKILMKRYGHKHKVEFKGINNLVTEADRKSEHYIIKKISKRYPEHEILAEESGQNAVEKIGEEQITWIIDPLDGTTNFAHNFPLFAVSIGIRKEDELVAGIVYIPFTKELFYAGKGKGAYLNGKEIKVSETDSLSDSIVATGFPPEHREINLPAFKKMLNATRATRRTGSAALDLCYIACGRLDGFWEFGLQPWDIAAGTIIVEEAGGRVTNIDQSPLNLRAGQILATNGEIHKEMAEELLK